MALSLPIQRSAGLISRRATRLTSCRYAPRSNSQYLPTRTLFSWFKKPKSKVDVPKPPEPILTEDNLFHPFSKSPFPAIKARGEAIQKLAPCPVCAAAHHNHGGMHPHAYAQGQPKAVSFECPDCGWPTHCSEEHWREDEEHSKYCGRLREVNEDEHDLRSGRRLREFELPGMYSQYFSLIAFHIVSHNRTTGHGSCHFVRELGLVLVHARIPVYGHGTFQETC